jgi:Uma2 family endonuclease
MTTTTLEAPADAEDGAPAEPVVRLPDALRALGDIPAERVIWLGREATEEDCIRYCEVHGPAELIDGLLVEKAMGFRESLLTASLIMYLKNFTSPRKLGLVGAPDAIMRVRKNQLRLPDVCFVTWARLLETDAHKKKVAPFGPDLAVEVLSEDNTQAEMDRKRREFFAAGTRLVWVIDPKTRTAIVYDDPARPNHATAVSETGTLDGGTVLPGFTLSLAALFGDIEPPANTPPSTNAK